MIYLKRFVFPSETEEHFFLNPPDPSPFSDEYIDFRPKHYEGSVYPFRVLPPCGLGEVEFSDITIFYGGNGSGKTTALNVIAEKLGLPRDTLFNKGRFFDDYLNLCRHNTDETSDAVARRRSGYAVPLTLPAASRIIPSDDVFHFSLSKRDFNERLYQKSEEVQKKFEEIKHSGPNLRSLADYERWKERRETLKSKSAFLKRHLEKEEEEHSGGETAMLYFLKKMEDSGLYLLDEPENSLSFENQQKLAEYIASSVRFFGCQFILATHSPVFLALERARIYDLDAGEVADSWTELAGVRALYDFFKAHEGEFS